MVMWYEDQSKIASLFVVIVCAISVSMLPVISSLEKYVTHTGALSLLYGILAAMFAFPFFYASDPAKAVHHSILIAAIYVELTVYGVNPKYVEFAPIVISYFILLFYHAQHVAEK